MGIGQFKSQHIYCSLYAECKTVLKLFNMLKENVDWMEDRLFNGQPCSVCVNFTKYYLIIILGDFLCRLV